MRRPQKWKLIPLDDVRRVPEKSGPFWLYKNYFWILTESDEIILFHGFSPQANLDGNCCESLLRSFKGKDYPGVKYKFVENVFLPYEDK